MTRRVREMAPKCGSLPRDAGDLVGLVKYYSGLLSSEENLHITIKENHISCLNILTF